MYSKNSVRNVTIVPCQKTFAQFARTTKPREISSTSPRPSDEIPARRCKLTHPARQIARILFASPCLYVPIPHPYSLSLSLYVFLPRTSSQEPLPLQKKPPPPPSPPLSHDTFQHAWYTLVRWKRARASYKGERGVRETFTNSLACNKGCAAGIPEVVD